MADELPSVDTETKAPKKRGRPKKATGGSASITVPLGEYHGRMTRRPRGFSSKLTQKQATNLRRATRGLQDSEATLENGAMVERPIDAIRWMLEQMEG